MNELLLAEYQKLCELHKLVTDLASQYYKNLYFERSLIHNLKKKYRPNDCYKKWSSRARQLARKNMSRTKGQRMVVDHIKPLLLCFIEGMTPEQASHISNLQLLSKSDNKKKSYLF